MGRKDAGATQGAPVDVYRKQIGGFISYSCFSVKHFV